MTSDMGRKHSITVQRKVAAVHALGVIEGLLVGSLSDGPARVHAQEMLEVVREYIANSRRGWNQ